MDLLWCSLTRKFEGWRRDNFNVIKRMKTKSMNENWKKGLHRVGEGLISTGKLLISPL